MIAETLIIHGGDFIEWRESSGFIDKPPRRISPEKLSIRFTKATNALRLIHKDNGSLLWQKNSAASSKIVFGVATADDLALPSSIPYAVEGTISDPTGIYLPRTFSLTLGSGEEHKIGLYHSPLGAQFSTAGGIFGQIHDEGGAVVPWALIILTVTPPSGPALAFNAQADRHGEFRLPLERLPAPTKATPAPSYAATLEVRASSSANPEIPLDPESQSMAKLATGVTGGGKTKFAAHLDLTIIPGTLARVVSPGHTQLVLKLT